MFRSDVLLVLALGGMAQATPAHADQAFPIAQTVCTPETGYFSVQMRGIWDVNPGFVNHSDRLNQMSVPDLVQKPVICRLKENEIRIAAVKAPSDCRDSTLDVEITINGKHADTLQGADCLDRRYDIAFNMAEFPPPVSSVRRPSRIMIDHCRADMPPPVGTAQANLRCETHIFNLASGKVD